MKKLISLLFVLFITLSITAQTTTDTWEVQSVGNAKAVYALGVDVDSAGTGYSQEFLIANNLDHDFSTQPGTFHYYLETADSIYFAVYWMVNNTSKDSTTHWAVADTLISAITASGAGVVNFDLNEKKGKWNKLKYVNSAPNAFEFSAGAIIE